MLKKADCKANSQGNGNVSNVFLHNLKKVTVNFSSCFFIHQLFNDKIYHICIIPENQEMTVIMGNVELNNETAIPMYTVFSPLIERDLRFLSHL